MVVSMITSVFTLFASIIIFPLGIHREPAFAYTLTLLEHFAYSPKSRERKDTEKDGKIGIFIKDKDDPFIVDTPPPLLEN